MTSDCAPTDMLGMEERLLTLPMRLTKTERPDKELRKNIETQSTFRWAGNFGRSHQFHCRNVTDNVRDLKV